MPPGGVKQTLATLDEAANSIAYREVGSDQYIYYCSTSSKKLRRRHINTSSEVELEWPIASMECDGVALHWDNVRDVLIFTYKQNGLVGFAEHLDPSL